MESEGHCMATQGESDFYAWFLEENSLVGSLFPDLKMLQDAWEHHPLLSKVNFESSDTVESGDTIRTCLHNRSKFESHKALDPVLSMEVDDVLRILSRPNLIHHRDYKLAKRIVREGEEHLGMLPNPGYSLEEIVRHFNLGGFSVVINDVQNRWPSVARISNHLEDELLSIRTGVNLYLTPEAVEDRRNGSVRQGFESHWDWMDVIVVQLSGRKLWSVARNPSIYLSMRDQKRQPKSHELNNLHRYEEFTLCPGDALYIPRGHIHNASTVNFAALSGSGALRECSKDSFPERLSGPSLHLTFGIMTNRGSVEALLHYAIDASGALGNVAIPSCNGVRGITWRTLLHHSLSEVSRRTHPCDTIHFGHQSTPEKCNGNLLLRKSLPFFSGDNLIKDDDKEKLMTKIEQVYQQAIDIFRGDADLFLVSEFIRHSVHSSGDDELRFSYPSLMEEILINCPDEVAMLSETAFRAVIEEFVLESRDDFQRTWLRLLSGGRDKRNWDRSQQKTSLENAAGD